MVTNYSQSQARQFRETFKAELGKYWQGILGFDVVRFDDEIVKSGNQSCRDAVRQTWGQDAVVFVNELLGIQ